MQVGTTAGGAFKFQISNTCVVAVVFLGVYLTGGFGKIAELSICPVETTLGTLSAPAPIVFALEAINRYLLR